MKTTVGSLKDLYVKLGGSIDGTYDDIADGVPVSDYVTIPDCIAAITELAGESSLVATSDGNGSITLNVR